MRISDWSSDVCSSDLERDGKSEVVGNGGNTLAVRRNVNDIEQPRGARRLERIGNHRLAAEVDDVLVLDALAAAARRENSYSHDVGGNPSRYPDRLSSTLCGPTLHSRSMAERYASNVPWRWG